MKKTVNSVAFVSNFFNHHQKPFSDAMYQYLGDGYHFIETEPISEERLKMGWRDEENIPYLTRSYLEGNADKCKKIIDEADVVILGHDLHGLIRKRLKKGKLTFICAERFYKDKIPYLKLPLLFVKRAYRYCFGSLYALCASAYTALDLSKTLSLMSKTYKWGYFPAIKEYGDIDKLIENKSKSSILWVARLIDWKHPEIPILIAKRLKEEGYSFSMSLIGRGELEEETGKLISKNDLDDHVKMLGVMSPEQVREHMEKASVFMFTSDRNEGWGAVLNEAMNSACGVVANSAIGSVPFLIEDGENGYMYKDGDLDDLYNKVKLLLDDNEKRARMGKKAYLTMLDEWNANNAAKKLIGVCECILSGERKPLLYEKGVCSKATILKDGWYK